MDYHRNVEIYLDVKQNEHEAILAGSERASNLGKILGHWVTALGQGGGWVGAGGKGRPFWAVKGSGVSFSGNFR